MTIFIAVSDSAPCVVAVENQGESQVRMTIFPNQSAAGNSPAVIELNYARDDEKRPAHFDKGIHAAQIYSQIEGNLGS
jgi:hypothetical protein